MSPRSTVAWPRVIDDMTHLGLTVEDLADRLGIRSALVARIAAGDVPPKPLVADRIVGLWVHLTGKPEKFIHLRVVTADAVQVQADGEGDSEERSCSCALLRAVVAQWVSGVRKR